MFVWPLRNSGMALYVNTSAVSREHRVSEVGNTYRGGFSAFRYWHLLHLSPHISKILIAQPLEGSQYEILLAGSDDIIRLAKS